MNLDLALEKFESAFTLPIALYKGETLLKQYTSHPDSMNLAQHLMKPYIHSEYNVCFLSTSDYLLCGLLRLQNSDEYLIIGPSSPYELTRRQAENVLRTFKLPLSRTDELLTWFHHIPIMNAKNFRDTLDFLNCILNDGDDSEPIHVSYHIPHIATSSNQLDLTQVSPFLHEAERFIMPLIEYGRYAELEKIFDELRTTNRLTISNLASNAVRAYKNTFIASTALAARAAIRGGLAYSTALPLSDYYIAKVEKLTIYTDVDQLQKTMMLDYTKRSAKVQAIQTDSMTITAICRYVQNNLYGQISCRDIAVHLDVSVSYVSRHFKEKTGKTVSDYIQEQKIKEALFLLTTTDLPLSALAEELGFSSQPYFQTVFKKYTDTTPLAYRQVNKSLP